MRADDEDALLTPDDVEGLFKIAKATQAAMRSRREIPFVLVGPRMPRYRRSEITAWLAERTVPAGPRRGRR
jgi:predicted DNA-binding transcriptional regulator AlpA